MKTLLATLISTALVVPTAALAGHCSSKAYGKHHGYSKSGAHHPHAYGAHYDYMKRKHHAKMKHHKMMKKHHPKYYQKYPTGGYKSASPHSQGGDMYYLHLPKQGETDNLTSIPAPQEIAQAPAAETENAVLANIVNTAAEAGQFNTLIEAVKAAGLEETLTGPGPFTVFAPTDEAFSRLPESILKALTEDSQALADLLTAHVVPGRVTAADAMGLNSAKSVQGSELAIDSSDGVSINGAKVISTDIEASNGIIHVIDSVIFPQS